jgi:integrase
MANGQALTLEPDEVPLLFERVEVVSRNPIVDGLLAKLSFRGALRASEMAGLTLDAVLDPRGRLRDEIRISVTKRREGRTIFMHPEIREAIEQFRWAYPNVEWFAVSSRDGRQMSKAAVGQRLQRLYENLGFIGCTSHSGRATCITEMAQRASEFGCSLWDVKEFAGHKHLSSTARYLRPSERGRDLVNGIGGRNPFNQTRRRENGIERITRDNRNAHPNQVLRLRQHEAWMAEQFARIGIQPPWRAERGGNFARY